MQGARIKHDAAAVLRVTKAAPAARELQSQHPKSELAAASQRIRPRVPKPMDSGPGGGKATRGPAASKH